MAKKSSTRTRPTSTKKKTPNSTYYIATVVGVVVIAMVFAVSYAVYTSKDKTGQIGAVPLNTVNSYGMAVGDPNAKAQVVIYEDFQCPYCDEFETAAKAQLTQAAADGKAYVIYYPIAFLDRASTTNYSTRALNAFGVVLNASGVTVADKFHDLLYENQPAEETAGLTDDQLIGYAVAAGADKAAVSQPISNLAFEQWTVNATDHASQNQVTGTPTVLVNGTKMEGQTIAEMASNTLAAVDAAQ